MDLTTIDKKLPIKAIPEKDLNRIILTQFTTWVSNLLSLTDEVSAQRLETSLPAVKEHCWSMGFEEIKKMFEMYADNKLSIKPLPNYFDRILFGKIVEAYRQQKPVKKVIMESKISQEEKDNLTYLGVINCFDEFMQTNKIIEGYTWVYDHLDELNIINYSDEVKRKQMPIAKTILISEAKKLDQNKYKQFIKDLENKNKIQAIINKAKKMLLERYFLILHAKNQHVKDILKQ